jgi:drug/metabolite transporter (DMT)-like permease
MNAGSGRTAYRFEGETVYARGMEAPASGSMKTSLALVVFGVFIASTSVIMIKASTIHPLLQSSYRLLGAVIVLVPFFFRELKARGERLSFRLVAPSILPGILLGLHFIAWIYGARLTLAGNSTVIVNMSPVVMPFLAFFLLGVGPSRREILGTVIATAGVAILAAADYRGDSRHFAGDLFCFVAMLLFTVYLALARKNNPAGRLWTYLVPLYFSGGVFCLIAAVALGVSPVAGIGWVDIVMTAGLALGPTIMGHSIMNWAMMRFAPQVVSILNLGQFIFAGLLAFALFGEVPRAIFYATSALIVTGAMIAIVPAGRRS